MALNIKNVEVERLAIELTMVTGESKTEAIRKALLERRDRISFQVRQPRRGEGFLRFLEDRVWPTVPPDRLGRRPSREEEDEILGFGPAGV